MENLNLEELNDFELQNIEGGIWYEVVATAIGIALGVGEFAEAAGQAVGRAYRDL